MCLPRASARVNAALLLTRDEDHMKISALPVRCRGAINEEMAETITECKKNGKLLPIMYKYT